MIEGIGTGYYCPICSKELRYTYSKSPLWLVANGAHPYAIEVGCPSCKIRNPHAGQPYSRAILLDESGQPIDSGVQPEWIPVCTGRSYDSSHNVYDDEELRLKEVEIHAKKLIEYIQRIKKENPGKI